MGFRTHIFYKEYTAAATYTAANTEVKLPTTCHQLKIIVSGADAEFSLSGADQAKVDGKVKSGEEINWTNLDFGKFAVKGAGATVRVWAWP